MAADNSKLDISQDIAEHVIPAIVRDQWRSRLTPELASRLEILTACGPFPQDADAARTLRHLRARRAAWESYLAASWVCGLLDGTEGSDRIARFASPDRQAFRAVMAECMGCWLFAAKLHYSIVPSLEGRNGRNLDFGANIGENLVGIEVKAPYREQPDQQSWEGGESDKIVKAIKDANGQFADDRPNILFLAPTLRIPMHINRRDLLHACYGISVIVAPFNSETGEAGEFQTEFRQSGKFLNRINATPSGGYLPGFTRISAVICCEEIVRFKYPHPDFRDWLSDLPSENRKNWFRQRELHLARENEAWVDHHVFVLHNPHAKFPMKLETFERFPQFVFDDSGIGSWTDGESAFV